MTSFALVATSAVLIGATLGAPTVATTPDGAPVPGRALATNGAIATNGQVLPPDGPPRVPPWQSYHGGVFSADGRSVAYPHTVISREEDVTTLKVQRAGEAPRVVWDADNRNLGLPSWSPDGDQIAVATGNFGMELRNSDVWLVDPAGVDPPQEILTGRGGEVADVAWSPDGSTIAYLRYSSDVFLYDVATGVSTQLTDFCTWEADATPPGPFPDCGDDLRTLWDSISWSPDGSRLVGTVNKQVVVVDAVTGALTASLADGAFHLAAVWSPDGTEIAYTRLERPGFRPVTYVQPATGGRERLVSDSELTSWQPCPDAPCATFGTPRARSQLRASVARGREAVLVRGEVGPVTDPEGSGREAVRATLQVKRAGRWRQVAVKEARLDVEDLGFTAKLPRPDGSQCRVQVRYDGGWTRGAASTSVGFRC